MGAGEMNAVTVSVIMPNYNYGPFLDESFSSLLRQTFKDFEVIFIDDGSSDDSRKIAESYIDKFAGRLIVICQQNQGVYHARNAGLKCAIGKYIAFFDADDIWPPESLDERVAFLNDNPDMGIVYSNVEFFHSDSGRAIGLSYGPKTSHQPFTGDILVPLFVRDNFVNNVTPMMRREVFDKVGYFDENFKVGGDYDYWLKAASDFTYGYIPEILCRQRRHSMNLTFKELSQGWARLRIIRNILRYAPRIRNLIGEREISDKWYAAYYRLGMALILEDKKSRGRKFLKRALRINSNPFKSKIYAYYALSFVPCIKKIKELRQNIRQRRSKKKMARLARG